MKINELAFVGYSVSDMKRSRAFYEGVLGLQHSRVWGDEGGPNQWIEYDIGPGCLAIVSGGGKEWPPGSTGVAAAFEVEDFQATISELRAGGATFVFEPYESPVCWMAVINDPDGNRVVIHKRKQSA